MNTVTLIRATEPIVIEASINAPLSRVWKAITDRNEMKHWHFNIKEFEAVTGFEFKIAGTRSDRAFPISCRIIEVKPEEMLSYTWSYDDFPAETIVTFELKREGNGTLVRLIHKGLDKISPVDRDISVENHADGWSHIIGKLLKDYVERKATLFVIKSIEVNASAEKVWNVLTRPDLTKQWIREWWPELSILESDWKPGSTVQWRVADGEIGADGKVLVCEPFTLLRFSFIVTDSLRQEVVTYRLQPRDGGTNLTVTIGNFGDTPDHELCYPGAVESWDKSLPKIKEMAELE